MVRTFPTLSLAPESRFRRGTLEFGPKILFRKDDAFLDGLFTELFRSYRQLLKHCDAVSLLFWLGDGTDILQYDGTPDQPIAWARWQGFAHPCGDPPRQPVLYTDDPVALTVGDIRRVIAAARRACEAVLGKPLAFILPFDPGSEFTEAPFRYERHPEILMRTSDGAPVRCIDAIGRLHADPARFAGYPDGIPEGTSFGEFLGRQTRAYFADIGADAIWFSNSFGFGRSPYASGGTGQFFDGERFMQEGNRAVRDAVIAFWEAFRRECPDLPVLCRGTDFTVGMNIVNHASAYRALCDGNRFGIVPPPNTPWPALNRNHGLALAGYLTQNAPFPEPCLPLRFYATDQWFCNNPWFDRWDRSPHDIYLTAALCKFGPDGALRAFDSVHVMGVDGSWGETPSEIADEVIPHLKRAAALRPDAPPPLVWVYPFDEFDEMVFGDNPAPDIPFGGDLSIIGALNHAFPLAGVVTTANFAAYIASHSSLREAVLVTPAPVPDSEAERLLLGHLAAGGQILCYGTLRHASAKWLAALGLAAGDTPLDGEFEIAGDIGGAPSRRLLHDAVIGQGGLCETAVGAAILTEAVAPDGRRRVLAAAHGRAAAQVPSGNASASATCRPATKRPISRRSVSSTWRSARSAGSCGSNTASDLSRSSSSFRATVAGSSFRGTRPTTMRRCSSAPRGARRCRVRGASVLSMARRAFRFAPGSTTRSASSCASVMASSAAIRSPSSRKTCTAAGSSKGSTTPTCGSTSIRGARPCSTARQARNTAILANLSTPTSRLTAPDRFLNFATPLESCP